MAEVLVAIVDESLSLSGDVLKIIMAQLMDKSVVRIPNINCPDDVSFSALNSSVSTCDEENFEQIRTAHDLVKRIHASSPNLLPTVIPQLEEELHADAPTLRVIATQNVWLGRGVDKSPTESSNEPYSAPPELAEAIEFKLSSLTLPVL
ncbi:hypothetical protein EV359DRAFT_79632 [Lentinula novae-zelandiae]|nr:hypothetical protein EV359DRAFT_79632 [Lentinula novae-zelandiae]